MPRVRVLGIGNVLRGDDGIGVRVVERLLSEGVPVGIEVYDMGTAGLDLALVVDDVEHIVIVDAVRLNATPGTVRWFRHDEMMTEEHCTMRSSHGLGIAQAISLAEHLGARPTFWICGIQPASIDYSLELSQEVSCGVSEAAALIRQKVLEMV